ncbi:DNA polymerase family B domain-containing protein [Ditylenchus destructor]|uniref:DNA polymerase n=1 Tax=Ditylenchus destructor TaxID=166010 RepID=A0AAD4N4U0_9BILA|nr:DNA polymerase family B domain-containing protein [Ditylenchus destructor]
MCDQENLNSPPSKTRRNANGRALNDQVRRRCALNVLNQSRRSGTEGNTSNPNVNAFLAFHNVPVPDIASHTEEEPPKLAEEPENLEFDVSNISLQEISFVTRSQTNSGSLRFYYLDAYEEPAKQPGTVYLFGRIVSEQSKSESCCVILRNIRRRLYFLKRDKNASTNRNVTNADLLAEVTERLKREFGVPTFKSKFTNRKFIPKFKTLPKQGTVLEVLIDPYCDKISANLSGDTFYHVFNTSSTALQRIVTEFEIKGPCWLDVTGMEKVEEGKNSYCKHEFVVDATRMRSINIVTNPPNLAPPSISTLCFNTLTVLNEEENERQIVMISMLHNASGSLDRPQLGEKKCNKRFCFVAPIKGQSLPYDINESLKENQMSTIVRTLDCERYLLKAFLDKLKETDPDILIGHDLNNQISLIVSRLGRHQLKRWSQFSRLKREWDLSKMGQSKSIKWEITAGRSCLDMKSVASELSPKSKTFEMDELVNLHLTPDGSEKSVRVELTMEEISDTFLSPKPSMNLKYIIEWNWKELLFCLKLVDKLDAIPLLLQITEIVGGILSRTLMGGRSERNEYLLLHACRKRKFIAPDRITFSEADDTKNMIHSGGMVFEPIKGLYDTYVILLDFKSFYPSIIQEYNICFTTVEDAFTLVPETNLPTFPGCSKPDGMLKSVISELVDRRKEVKSLIKKTTPGSNLFKQYGVHELALKLTANSLYGCLGCPQFRFAAKTLASMVTYKGREILNNARKIIESTNNYSVIYGDTDSIFVDTKLREGKADFAQVKAIGQELKNLINKHYKHIEFDMQGIYKKLVLLQKREYMGLMVDVDKDEFVKREIKGIDVIRRDCPMVAREIGGEAVDLILSDLDRDSLVQEIRHLLLTAKDKVERDLVPLEKYEIYRTLSRNPDEYENPQCHAIVAKRLNETGKFHIKAGDIVSYIICQDGTKNTVSKRAYHPSEVQSSDQLKIDTKYYLNQQMRSVVSRLCEPIREVTPVFAQIFT